MSRELFIRLTWLFGGILVAVLSTLGPSDAVGKDFQIPADAEHLDFPKATSDDPGGNPDDLEPGASDDSQSSSWRLQIGTE